VKQELSSDKDVLHLKAAGTVGQQCGTVSWTYGWSWPGVEIPAGRVTLLFQAIFKSQTREEELGMGPPRPYLHTKNSQQFSTGQNNTGYWPN
jgi:hypothetical protein